MKKKIAQLEKEITELKETFAKLSKTEVHNHYHSYCYYPYYQPLLQNPQPSWPSLLENPNIMCSGTDESLRYSRNLS